jgi:hypothetical protein
MRRFIEKPSPALIVAGLALVLALAGTSIAASQLGKNSVGARELGKVKQRSKTDSIDPAVNDRGAATAKCKSGEQLLGGGATLPNADPASTDPPSIEQNGPLGQRRWTAVAHSDNDTVTLRVTALCLKK